MGLFLGDVPLKKSNSHQADEEALKTNKADKIWSVSREHQALASELIQSSIYLLGKIRSEVVFMC